MSRRETKTTSSDGGRSSLSGMRACIVLEAPEIGGAEVQASLLARYLIDRERCHVEVWTILPGSNGGLREHLQKLGVPLRELGFTIPATPWGRAAKVVELAVLFRAARMDIILPFTTLPNMLSGLAFRLSGARVCVWNERVAAPEARATWAQRMAAALTPIFIANSRLGGECLTRIYGASPGRVHVVNNGLALLPAALGREAWRSRLGVGADAIVACMVANVHARKDHATAIRGFSLALERARPRSALLVCAGTWVPETHRNLVSLARELGVEDKVVFPGRVSDVAGLLSASDIGIFCSHFEGTPNGVLECMAMGLPVVATDLPGIRDALGPEGARWLLPPGDAEGLAQRVLLLIKEPDLRQEVGLRNRVIIEQNFTAESMGARTVDVIRRALS
jgi:glycosyltransferase involved in cell wall biosynthesis